MGGEKGGQGAGDFAGAAEDEDGFGHFVSWGGSSGEEEERNIFGGGERGL